MTPPSVYCFDTSAFINGWRRHFAPDIVPGFWEALDELINDGQIISTVEVLRELSKKDDDIHNWTLERKHMFVDVDNDIERAVAEIMERFPRLVDANRKLSAADPFVIALAKVQGCTVVTDERPATSAKRPPQIPDVCRGMGIRVIDLFQLAREQGWKFWRT